MPNSVNSPGKFSSTIVKTLKPAFTSLAVVSLYNEEKSFGDKIVYHYGLFETGFDRCYISLDNSFKGIVQRKLRSVESSVNQ